MKSKSRKLAVVLTVCGALLCVLFFFAGLYLLTCDRKQTSSSKADTLSLEMTVGGTYDLKSYFKKGGQVEIDYGAHQSIAYEDIKNCVSLDAQGNLHALKAGIYNIKARLVYEVSLFGTHTEPLVNIELIVNDYEFDDYKPVGAYADFQEGVYEKYILMRDIVVKRDSLDEVMDFSGIFVNPEGYEVTVADDYPLFNRIGDYSHIDGMNVKTDADGIHKSSLTLSDGGMIACYLGNKSVISDSKAEADIYGEAIFSGFVSFNWGKILRCEFRGTLFDLVGNRNIMTCFAIAQGGVIRDCTVYADGYRGSVRDVTQRVSVFHTDAAPLYDPSVAFETNGNRVFDLSGEHEVDFEKIVSYTAAYRAGAGLGSYKAQLFAGCVAQYPEDMPDLLEKSRAEYVGCKDGAGNAYSSQETCFVSAADEFGIEIDVKYKETFLGIGYASKIVQIDAAESVVAIPEGCSLACSVEFGIFCPETVTLKLAADTQVEYDAMFIADGRAQAYGEKGVSAALDIGASQVYEQREGGVFRIDNGKLCRYDGQVQDGTVTVPDGVTQMSGDAFGPLEFECLDTNDLLTLEVVYQAQWPKNVKTLRLGAATEPRSLSAFSALERIETEERTDGYYAEDGILYDGEAYSFVPCAYAAGGTLTLRDKDIHSGALRFNLAEKIVLENVGEVSSTAFDRAQCAEIVVRGEGTLLQKHAVYMCGYLVSFEADGKVSLQSESICDCLSLEGIELNENYQSVAYDAVQNCANFVGYALADGCDRFAVSDGILFVGGKARLPQQWLDECETLTVPEGISDVQLISELSGSNYKFKTVLLSKDVQTFSAVNVPAASYELAQESAFLAAQDGVPFNADMTKLLAYPKNRGSGSYEVPESVATIADYAFAYARNLRRIDLGQNTEYVGSYAFYKTELTEIDMPQALVGIGNYAFAEAELGAVALPQSLQTLGEYAFTKSDLLSVSVAGVDTIGTGTFTSAKIGEIALFEGVRTIGQNAFYDAELKSITMPDSLLFIGDSAFRGSALQEVVLGKNLAEAGDWAFYDCEDLSSVTALSAVTAYGKDCFAGTPFLMEGKTAENGAIYLSNTMFGFFGEGESAEVRYGTTDIKSLDSLNVKSLKLPQTLSQMPSVEGLPYLEQLWLGVAPEGAEPVTFDAGDAKFRAKSDFLYIRLPKHVTFGGTLGDDVYICYDGTPEEFARYARLDNINEYCERVYYFSETGGGNTWYVDGQGNMCLRGLALSDKFVYEYSYGEEGLCCAVTGYEGTRSEIEIPRKDPRGLPVTAVRGLGDTYLDEVRIEGMDVYFKGHYNVKCLYIAADCEVSVFLDPVYPKIEFLFTDAAVGYFSSCYNVQNIVAGESVRELYFAEETKVYYEGTPEMWLENVVSDSLPYAYYSAGGDFPDDGNLYWKYASASGLPALWL